MPCTFGMISQVANDMGGMPINIVNATIQSQVHAMNPNLPNISIQVQSQVLATNNILHGGLGNICCTLVGLPNVNMG